ncbi:MAG: cupredoxin domain-containing protein [Proteobacteria bacterium]|nr:cupredoxin domain-containing protein [Pseudomonadota bacterium]
MKVVETAAPTVLLVLIIAGFLSPALAQDNDDSQLAAGERVFNTVAGIGCKTCHGEYAEGDVGVGPYLRGASEGAIRAAIDATGEMVVIKSVITEDEIKAVVAYVGKLGTLQPVRTLAKRGRFLPQEISIRPGTGVQLIIKNASIQPHTFKSDNMNIEELVIAGRSSGSLEWRAPETEGEFAVYCTNCKLKDQLFVIKVAASAAPFRQVAPVGTTTDSAM